MCKKAKFCGIAEYRRLMFPRSTLYSTGFSTDCGVVTHQPSGLIKAPDSNGDGWHDPFVDCLWTLRAGTGKVIKYGLTFNDGHSYAECSQDMLWVRTNRNGSSQSAPNANVPALATTKNYILAFFLLGKGIQLVNFRPFFKGDSLCDFHFAFL